MEVRFCWLCACGGPGALRCSLSPYSPPSLSHAGAKSGPLRILGTSTSLTITVTFLSTITPSLRAAIIQRFMGTVGKTGILTAFPSSFTFKGTLKEGKNSYCIMTTNAWARKWESPLLAILEELKESQTEYDIPLTPTIYINPTIFSVTGVSGNIAKYMTFTATKSAK